jgi:chemotaxis protein CheX
MTQSAQDDAPVVRADDVVWIARDVWSSFLDVELDRRRVPTQRAAADDVTGVIEVTGAWRGSIEVSCAAGVASALAGAMLGDASGADPGRDDVADALGELTNMVGGNVKSLLPAPSRLSLPVVRVGPRPEDGAELVSHVELVARGTGEPVSISVWAF